MNNLFLSLYLLTDVTNTSVIRLEVSGTMTNHVYSVQVNENETGGGTNWQNKWFFEGYNGITNRFYADATTNASYYRVVDCGKVNP